VRLLASDGSIAVHHGASSQRRLLLLLLLLDGDNQASSVCVHWRLLLHGCRR